MDDLWEDTVSTPEQLEAVAGGLDVLYPDIADEFRYYAGLPVGGEWDESYD